jgi:hypothetical protein
MKILELDDEQGQMIVIALEASNALLEARFHRVDPDQILSNSFLLQKHKIEQIAYQLQCGSVAQWQDLDLSQRTMILLMMANALQADDQATEAMYYDKLVSVMLSHRKPAAAPSFLRERA